MRLTQLGRAQSVLAIGSPASNTRRKEAWIDNRPFVSTLVLASPMTCAHRVCPAVTLMLKLLPPAVDVETAG